MLKLKFHWANLRASSVALVFAVVGAGMLGAGTPAHAEGAWCAGETGGDGAYVNCIYDTYAQCRAAIGVGSICYMNPDRRRVTGGGDQFPPPSAPASPKTR